MPVPHASPPRRRAACRRAGAGGFTVVELLVTVCLIGVLAGIGAPALADLAHSVRLRGQAQTLLFALHLARTEAIRRNGRVTLCKSADGQTCATGGRWDQGLIVFEDANSNGLREAGEALLHREGALPADYLASGNGTVKDAISYASNLSLDHKSRRQLCSV